MGGGPLEIPRGPGRGTRQDNNPCLDNLCFFHRKGVCYIAAVPSSDWRGDVHPVQQDLSAHSGQVHGHLFCAVFLSLLLGNCPNWVRQKLSTVWVRALVFTSITDFFFFSIISVFSKKGSSPKLVPFWQFHKTICLFIYILPYSWRLCQKLTGAILTKSLVWILCPFQGHFLLSALKGLSDHYVT